MKKFIAHLSLLSLLSLAVVAQESTNEPPVVVPPPAPIWPHQTYTNGISIRLPLTDDVYLKLVALRRITGNTNTFLSVATNNLALQMTPAASAVWESECRSAALRIIALPGDAGNKLARIKTILDE